MITSQSWLSSAGLSYEIAGIKGQHFYTQKIKYRGPTMAWVNASELSLTPTPRWTRPPGGGNGKIWVHRFHEEN